MDHKPLKYHVLDKSRNVIAKSASRKGLHIKKNEGQKLYILEISSSVFDKKPSIAF